MPAVVVEDVASPTKRPVRLGPAPEEEHGFGNLAQQLDARSLRGKRVIVRAEVRLAPHESATQLRTANAQMWVRVDRENGEMGFFDNMDDRPIRGLRAATPRAAWGSSRRTSSAHHRGDQGGAG